MRAQKNKKIYPEETGQKEMFESNLNYGELEIGQVSALISEIKSAAEIVKEIWLQFNKALSAPLK